MFSINHNNKQKKQKKQKHKNFKPLSLIKIMGDEQYDNSQQSFDYNAKIREIEEKQKIQKDRLLLISKNLIEIKETSNEKFLEIKKELENLRQGVNKIKSFLDMLSEEISNFARKEDVEILSKQAKMFQPLK
jgi:predicted adenine nucleotide alpha hydrolase (AANH) superfamily ATPase